MAVANLQVSRNWIHNSEWAFRASFSECFHFAVENKNSISVAHRDTCAPNIDIFDQYNRAGGRRSNELEESRLLGFGWDPPNKTGYYISDPNVILWPNTLTRLASCQREIFIFQFQFNIWRLFWRLRCGIPIDRTRSWQPSTWL